MNAEQRERERAVPPYPPGQQGNRTTLAPAQSCAVLTSTHRTALVRLDGHRCCRRLEVSTSRGRRRSSSRRRPTDHRPPPADCDAATPPPKHPLPRFSLSLLCVRHSQLATVTSAAALSPPSTPPSPPAKSSTLETAPVPAKRAQQTRDGSLGRKVSNAGGKAQHDDGVEPNLSRARGRGPSRVVCQLHHPFHTQKRPWTLVRCRKSKLVMYPEASIEPRTNGCKNYTSHKKQPLDQNMHAVEDANILKMALFKIP